MDVPFSEDELLVLTYLHEAAEGYGEAFPFDCETVLEALGWHREVGEADGVDEEGYEEDGESMRRLSKAVSYLAEWQLVCDVQWGEGAQGTVAIQFCLAGEGEAFMRKLEKELQEQIKDGELRRKAGRLSMGLLKELYEAGKKRAIEAAIAGIIAVAWNR